LSPIVLVRVTYNHHPNPDETMENPTIAFIGGGNMAASLIGGLLADGWDAVRIRASDPQPAQREAIFARFGVHTGDDNVTTTLQSDVVVLAVKPQMLKAVTEEIAGAVQQKHPLVISIAAGIREPHIRQWLGGDAAIVRAMPNTPALIQAGSTGLFANRQVSESQRNLAESILRAVGLTLWVDDESLLDAVTALSGSGPAYFFLIMEIMEDVGTTLGLPAEQARLLTLQTAFGAAKMALESTESPARLRERVTSPGGTTERALQVFERENLRELFAHALKAARDRSNELATLLGDQ
jgi:pyrroline-5-carboxylate reductase